MHAPRSASNANRQTLRLSGTWPWDQNEQGVDIDVLKKVLVAQSERIKTLEAESECLKTESLRQKTEIAALERYAETLKQGIEAGKAHAQALREEIEAARRHAVPPGTEVVSMEELLRLRTGDVGALRAKTLVKMLAVRVSRALRFRVRRRLAWLR